MAAITVSLPDSLREFIENRASEQGYRTVGEYVGHLLEEEQKRETQDRLDGLLQEGIDSGKPEEVGAAYWNRKRRALAATLSDTHEKPGDHEGPCSSSARP